MSLRPQQFDTLRVRDALIKAQHRHGTGAGDASTNELIGQITLLAEVFEGINHAVDVVDHHAAGTHQPLQQSVAHLALEPVSWVGTSAPAPRNTAAAMAQLPFAVAQARRPLCTPPHQS